MASRHKPVVPDELLDRLLGGSDALEAFQSGDLVQDLKKHWRNASSMPSWISISTTKTSSPAATTATGHSRKRVLTDDGRMELSIPGIGKVDSIQSLSRSTAGACRGSDDKVISMVCPRHVGPRDPGSRAGTLRHQGLPGTDLQGHRCRFSTNWRPGSRGRWSRSMPSSTSMRCG